MILTTIINSCRCKDCRVPQRIGRFIAIFHHKSILTAISVFLIGQSPGY